MIRILQMVGGPGAGSARTMMMDIYRHIDRTRIQFDFVLEEPAPADFAQEAKALGARLYTMPGFRGINAAEIKRDWNNFFYTHPEYRVLHVHAPGYASLYLPIAARHGLKTIVHCHGISADSGAAAVAKNALLLPLRKQADILMASSDAAGIWLYGDRACKSERFMMLHSPVDMERFQFDEAARRRYRRELGLEKKLIIGHAGRFEEAGNHSFLLEAFAHVHEKRPEAVLLLIGGGKLQMDVARKAVALGVAEDVIMMGERQDIPELLSAMDLFAFPSLSNELPPILIEAQAAGLPCIISTEVSADAEASSLVKRLPVDDARLWAKEMLAVKGRRDVKDELIRAGFHAGSAARGLSALYSSLYRESSR